MHPNENVRISDKGNRLLNNTLLAQKVSMAIALNPEKLYSNEGIEVEGLIVKSVLNSEQSAQGSDTSKAT